MAKVQVLERSEIKGQSVSVVIAVPSKEYNSTITILTLAGIGEKPGGEGSGWTMGDGEVLITQPWVYRGRIDHVIRMLHEKWHPGFRSAFDLKVGVI